MSSKYVGFGKKLFDFAAKRGEKSNVVSTIVGVAPKISKTVSQTIKKRNKASKDLFEASKGRKGLKDGSPKKKKLNQGDILGNRFDKKFKKLALSKEAQLHAKDYDEGIDRGERRAANEVAQEAGLPTMNKGGRVGRKFGGGMDMSRRKTNVEKIKETLNPKKSAAKTKNLNPVDKKKNPGLAKLPIEVRNKMGYAKKGGRA